MDTSATSVHLFLHDSCLNFCLFCLLKTASHENYCLVQWSRGQQRDLGFFNCIYLCCAG